MTWNNCLFAFVFLLSTSLTASNFISDNVFESYGSTSRHLLQARKRCPIDFESLNYTVITSQCKGPHYPAKLCCKALLEISCPYVDSLNDMTNDCATTLFSYINLYGKYPPGLFSSECRGGKEGISCDIAPAPAANGAWTDQTLPYFPVLLTGLLLILIQML